MWQKMYSLCMVMSQGRKNGKSALALHWFQLYSFPVVNAPWAVSKKGHQSLPCPHVRLHSEPAEPFQPLKAMVGFHLWHSPRAVGDVG